MPLVLLLLVAAGFIATALAGSRWAIEGQATEQGARVLRVVQ